MTEPAAVVRAMFDAYRTQDASACVRLLADDFVFTSPQDDHLDRDTFLERCFPTADRFVRQDLVHVTPASGTDVFVLYEYELRDGGRFRNTELITVRDGRIVETQVFFGGAVERTPLE